MLLCISQLQYNMLLVDEPNSLQMGLIPFLRVHICAEIAEFARRPEFKGRKTHHR